MERWAANTLRILGIILTSIVVICGCLLLILLGQCASQGGYGGSRNPTAATNYFLGAALVAIAGIAFIAWLARGIHRSGQLRLPVAGLTSASPTAPGSLSSEGQRAVDLLFWCFLAQIAVRALTLVYSILLYQRMPRMPHSYVIATVVSSVLYALPYVVLLYFLRQRISRAVLGFALGFPSASIVLIMITSLPLITNYVHNLANAPMFILPIAIDVATVTVAYQAQRQTGLVLPVSSLLTAVVASFASFYSLHLIVQFVYRNFVR